MGFHQNYKGWKAKGLITWEVEEDITATTVSAIFPRFSTSIWISSSDPQRSEAKGRCKWLGPEQAQTERDALAEFGIFLGLLSG